MLGGLAAGFGSMLYDALFGGYDLINCLITFVSKFLMAAICAWIAFGGKEDGKASTPARRGQRHRRSELRGTLYAQDLHLPALCPRVPLDAVVVTMGSKLPASLINAVFAMIVAPILYAGNRPGAAPQRASGKAPQIIEEKRQAARRKTLRAAFWMFRRRMLFPDRF